MQSLTLSHIEKEPCKNERFEQKMPCNNNIERRKRYHSPWKWKTPFSKKEFLAKQLATTRFNTTFCYSCEMFGLRATDEHRCLQIDQFKIDCDENERFFGLKQHSIGLRIYERKELVERCAALV